MRPANWDRVTHNQCLLKKKSWSLYILEPQAAKRTLLDSSARYCCHTHPSVELLTRSLSTFSLLSWQRTHVHTRHTGKELLDARFPIRKMEKETESEAPPSSIKKRRCGYKKDWENEYLWLKCYREGFLWPLQNVLLNRTWRGIYLFTDDRMLDGHKEQMFGKPHQVRNPGEEQLHIQLQGLLHLCSEREGSPQCCTIQQEIQVQEETWR